MTPLALIVEWHTPDLLALCRASLARFAPEVEVMILPGGPGPEYHALAIHRARAQLRGVKSTHDPIILLDTDTCILSERWWPTLERAFGEGHDLIGGARSRGEACQMFLNDGRIILHASMLAMHRSLFDDRRVFFEAHRLDPELGCVTRDTAWQVSNCARHAKVIPFWGVTTGPVFPGLQVGEYHDRETYETIWSHLWRGTGMSAGTRWRQVLRLFRAACGSQSAWTMLRAAERKQLWMEKAWEIVRA